MFANIPLGVAFLDRELRYVQRLNRGLAELGARPAEAYAGRTVPDVFGAVGEHFLQAGAFESARWPARCRWTSSPEHVLADLDGAAVVYLSGASSDPGVRGRGDHRRGGRLHQ